MNTSYRQISVQPLSPNIGAEIQGVDVNALTDGQFVEVRQAFAQFGVIFFRNQRLSPDQHIAFAQRWATINVNRFFTAVADYPVIAEVRKEPTQTANIGGSWHADHSYDIHPAMGSILYALEVPQVGGDTLFASMYAAYDALSEGLKHTLSGLSAVHSSRHVFGNEYTGKRVDLQNRLHNQSAATQDTVHPVVITHPESGRPALYVNPGFTVRFDGWTEEESQPLLGFLASHATRPEFICRFQWQPGSIAFWDNRATWHYAANDYQGQRRLMHRITVEGVALSPAAQRERQTSTVQAT